MLSNNKGFTLIEVLISASMILTLMAVVFPISTMLEKERIVLSDRRTFMNQLHDEFQPYLWNDLPLPMSYSTFTDQTEVTFEFMKDKDFIKGCAIWESARKKREKVCLYGYS